LAQLEEEHLDAEGRAKIARRRDGRRGSPLQLTLFSPIDHPLLEDIRQVDLDQTTPLAALQLIRQWQETLQEEKAKKRR
jgi:DNA mismatch repair protein MutS